MAIDLTGNVQSISATTAANAVVTKPTGVVEGDWVLLWEYIEDDVVPTPPSGFAQIGATIDHPSQPMDFYVWGKRAGASEPSSYTITHSSAYRQAGAQRVPGVKLTGDPVDGTPSTATGTGTTGTMGSVSPAGTNGGLFFFLFWWDATKAGGQGSWSGGLTERLDTTQVAFASEIVAASGSTGTRTVTLSAAGSDEFGCLGFVLAEEPAGGGVTVDLAGAPATAVAVVVDPTIVLGSLALDVGIASAVAVVVDPSVVTGNIALDVGAAPAVAVVVDPSVVLGSTSADVGAAPAVATVVDPTVALGSTSVDLAATAAAAVATVLDPTVMIGSGGPQVTGSVALVESTQYTVALVEGREFTADLVEGQQYTVTLAETIIV